MDVEGAEFETIAAMEAYYGEAGPPVVSLVEWPGDSTADGDAGRSKSETIRDGRERLPPFAGDGRRLCTCGTPSQRDGVGGATRMERLCEPEPREARAVGERRPNENDERHADARGAIASAKTRGLLAVGAQGGATCDDERGTGGTKPSRGQNVASPRSASFANVVRRCSV